MRRLAILALLLTAAAPVDRRTELSLTEARAQATGSAVSTLTTRISAQERRIGSLTRRINRLLRQIKVRETELARRQAELLPSLAALESLSRRPPALLLLDPARSTDMARTGLVFDAMLPAVRERSDALRADLVATNRLKARLVADRRALITRQEQLDKDVRALMALGSQLARRAATLRDLLDGVGTSSNQALRVALVRPAEGSLITSFGTPGNAGYSASGLTVRTAADAVVGAPAAGRIAFTGPFRAYGPIVIIEHGGGLVTLIAGLSQIDIAAGDAVLAGQPIGRMGAEADPRELYFELRAGGVPVDPKPWFAAR